MESGGPILHHKKSPSILVKYVLDQLLGLLNDLGIIVCLLDYDIDQLFKH